MQPWFVARYTSISLRNPQDVSFLCVGVHISDMSSNVSLSAAVNRVLVLGVFFHLSVLSFQISFNDILNLIEASDQLCYNPMSVYYDHRF